MSYRSTALAYYCYRATTLPGFTWPVVTLFLLSRGLTYTEIATASAVLATASLVSELPTGFVADRVGRRAALVVSALLFLVGQLLYAAVHSVAVAALAAAIVGVAEAFQSGSLGAWLYDALAAHGRADAFTEVRARGAAVRYWSGAGMMVLSGPLYVLDHRLPFLAMAAVNALSASVLLGFPLVGAGRGQHGSAPEAGPAPEPDGAARPAAGGPLGVREAATVVREHLLSGSVRWFVVYAGLVVALVRGANGYIQPIAVDVLEGLAVTGGGGGQGSLGVLVRPLVGAVQVPPPATLGLMYAGFTALAAVTSGRAAAVERRLGARCAMLVLPGAMAVGLLVPLALPGAALPAFFLLRGGSPVLVPIRSRYLNDRVPAVGRATVLSAAGLCFGAIRIPVELGVGVLADHAGPFVAVAGLGAGFLLCTGALLAFRSPFGAPRNRAVAAD